MTVPMSVAMVLVSGLVALACTPEPGPGTTTTTTTSPPVAATIEAVGTSSRTGDTAAPYTPLVVRVRDASGAPLAGAAVRFEALPASADAPITQRRAAVTFDGAAVADVTTGADGTAVVVPVANEWVGSVPVRATAAGVPSPVEFTLTNRIQEVRGAFPPDGSVPAPASPAFDGSSVWVAALGSSKVYRFRARDGAVVGTYAVGSVDDFAVDTDRIWMPECINDQLLSLDLTSGSVLDRFDVGDCPIRVARGAAVLWVVFQDGVLAAVDPHTGATVATSTLGARPEDLVWDGSSVWVSAPGAHTVSQFSEVLASDGVTPVGIRLDSVTGFSCPGGLGDAGGSLWVASPCLGVVTQLRKSDQVNLGDHPVCASGGAAIGAEFDGVDVRVSCGGAGTVDRVRIADGAVVETTTIGLTVYRMVSDGTNLWVPDNTRWQVVATG